jgi:hypothetical protein
MFKELRARISKEVPSLLFNPLLILPGTHACGHANIPVPAWSTCLANSNPLRWERGPQAPATGLGPPEQGLEEFWVEAWSTRGLEH